MGVRSRMRILNAVSHPAEPETQDPKANIPQKLLHIRFGPGAAILPKEIKRIHLDFAVDWNNGHLGPRRFWRTCLPRLKYHNPMVSMTVQRTKDQSSKPIMTIYYDGASTKTIDMQMKTDAVILQELLQNTNATEVVPSPEDVAALEEVEVQNARSQEDSRRGLAYRERLKEEKMMLERARQM